MLFTNGGPFISILLYQIINWPITKDLDWFSGEKPYSCVECGKKFSRQDKLKNHSR